MFLDEVTITVRAGNGGDGASTFRREAHVPRGGPDGGDGGRGGSVYLVVDAGQTMLRDYRYQASLQGRARRPRHRLAAARQGRPGPDLHVPPGTVVRDLASGDLIADLVGPRPARDGRARRPRRPGQHPLRDGHQPGADARPEGRAGRGAPAAAGAAADRRCRPGRPAQRGQVDAAGALTAATPQIASYPFTTLEPNLGVLDLSVVDASDERRATVADMPGLIEGASAGAGLGHAFLRHVERTRVLVHVVDLAAPNPERDYQIIRDELEAHDPAPARQGHARRRQQARPARRRGEPGRVPQAAQEGERRDDRHLGRRGHGHRQADEGPR